MTKQEALILLAADENNFEEVVTSSIFEHKQFLLKSVITPQVFKTRARKIATINEAYKFLTMNPLIEHQPKVSFENLNLKDLSIESLLNFYRSYETIMSQLKLTFMQENDPGIVSNSCVELSNLEHQKLMTISTATKSLEVSSLIEVKISEFINSGEIIKELKLSNDPVVNQKNLILLPTFNKDIIRSRKYANFTKLKN